MLLCEFILNSQPAPPGEPFLLRTLLELYLAEALPDEAVNGGGGGGDVGTRVPAASTKVRRCVAVCPCCPCCGRPVLRAVDAEQSCWFQVSNNHALLSSAGRMFASTQSVGHPA